MVVPGAFAPFFSPFLVDDLGRRGPFMVAPILATITLPITLRYVPETPRVQGRRVDIAGIAACGVALVYGISRLQDGLTAGVVVPPAIGVVAGAFFVWWEL